MAKHIYEGIVSTLSLIGVMILIASIFIFDDFGLGFVVAMAFWLLSGVIGATFETDEKYIPRDDRPGYYYKKETTVLNLKSGLTTLCGVIGVEILMIGIFIDTVPFNVAIVIALCFWMFTAILGSFIEDESYKEEKEISYIRTSRGFREAKPGEVQRSSSHRSSMGRSTTRTRYTETEVPNADYYGASANSATPSNKYKEKRANYCHNCGAEIDENAIFCEQCGEQL